MERLQESSPRRRFKQRLMNPPVASITKKPRGLATFLAEVVATIERAIEARKLRKISSELFGSHSDQPELTNARGINPVRFFRDVSIHDGACGRMATFSGLGVHVSDFPDLAAGKRAKERSLSDSRMAAEHDRIALDLISQFLDSEVCFRTDHCPRITEFAIGFPKLFGSAFQ